MSKAFTVYKRNDKATAVSVLLEKRDKPESLLFESGAVAELGRLSFTSSFDRKRPLDGALCYNLYSTVTIS